MGYYSFMVTILSLIHCNIQFNIAKVIIYEREREREMLYTYYLYNKLYNSVHVYRAYS